MWEGLAVTTQALLQGYVRLAGSSLSFSTGDNSYSNEVVTWISSLKVICVGDARETRKSGGQDGMNNIITSFVVQDN